MSMQQLQDIVNLAANWRRSRKEGRYLIVSSNPVVKKGLARNVESLDWGKLAPRQTKLRTSLIPQT